jgi:hypothetical protein
MLVLGESAPLPPHVTLKEAHSFIDRLCAPCPSSVASLPSDLSWLRFEASRGSTNSAAPDLFGQILLPAEYGSAVQGRRRGMLRGHEGFK